MRKPSEIAYSAWWWLVVWPLDAVSFLLFMLARLAEGSTPQSEADKFRMSLEDFTTMPEGADTFRFALAALQSTLPEGVEIVVTAGEPGTKQLRLFSNAGAGRVEQMLAAGLSGVAGAMESRRQAQNN